jgi:hypothetical protein
VTLCDHLCGKVMDHTVRGLTECKGLLPLKVFVRSEIRTHALREDQNAHRAFHGQVALSLAP